MDLRVTDEVKEDDLALFNHIKSTVRKNFLIQSPDDFDSTFSERLQNILDEKQNGHSSEMLNAESASNDYDWLLTPPDTPLFPSLDDAPATTNDLKADVYRNNPNPISRLPPIEKRYSSSPTRLRTASDKNSATPSRIPFRPRRKSPLKLISPPNLKMHLGLNTKPLSDNHIRDSSPRISASPKAYRNVQDHSKCDSDYSQLRKLMPKHLEFLQTIDKVSPSPNKSLHSTLQTVGEHTISSNKDITTELPAEIFEKSSINGEKMTISSEGLPLLSSLENPTCSERFTKVSEETANQENLTMIQQSSNDARISRCYEMIMDSRKLQGKNNYLNIQNSGSEIPNRNILQDRQIGSSIRSASSSHLTKTDISIKLLTPASDYLIGLSKKWSKQEETYSSDPTTSINPPRLSKPEHSAINGDDSFKGNTRDELASERVLLSKCIMNKMINQAVALALESERKMAPTIAFENERKSAAGDSMLEAPKMEPKCNCIIM